jgi:hypothetical protein
MVSTDGIDRAVKIVLDYAKEKMGMANLEADFEDLESILKP